MGEIVHAKTSVAADSGDATKIQPSDWNDGHDTSAFGIDDLADVTLGTPSTGQVLTYDTDHWEAANPGAASLDLDDLGDVNAPTPTNGQVLLWDSTPGEWVPGTASTVAALNDLSDVNAPSPTNLQVLQWDSTPGEWVAATAIFDPATIPLDTDLTGDLSTPVVTGASGTFALKGDLSPAAFGSSQNNYSPTGLDTAAVLRLSASAPSLSITGLAGGADGRIIVVLNIGAETFSLVDESASSSAANRFALSADIAITQDESVTLIYDSTSSRWRVMARKGATGATGADSTVPGPKGDSGSIEAHDQLVTVAASGTAVTVDTSTASVFDITKTANLTVTLTGPVLSCATILFHHTGNHTIAFSPTPAYAGGAAPSWQTTTGKTDIITVLNTPIGWIELGRTLNITTPTASLPTLDMVALATIASGTDSVGGSGSAYQTAGSVTFQDGDLGFCLVVSTRTTSVPTVPTVVGGGMTNWTAVGSQVVWDSGTGTRRAAQLYLQYQAVAGTPAPVYVDHGGVTHTSCDAIIGRIEGAPSATLATSKVVSGNGTSGTSATATLAAASDATNRPIAFVMFNNTTGSTPEGTWTELADVNSSSPSINLACAWRSDAFDTSVAFTNGSAGYWAVIATEIEQG